MQNHLKVVLFILLWLPLQELIPTIQAQTITVSPTVVIGSNNAMFVSE